MPRGQIGRGARAFGWLAVALPVVLGVSSATAGAQIARSSRSLSVADEGHLHLVKASGSMLIDEGRAKGTLPGQVKIRFTYNGNPDVSAQITIYANGGTIAAHGSGRLSSPTSATPSFRGSLAIDGGTGRYRRAHGSGHMYGVFYRRSYAITVQTEGSVRF